MVNVKIVQGNIQIRITSNLRPIIRTLATNYNRLERGGRKGHNWRDSSIECVHSIFFIHNDK